MSGLLPRQPVRDTVTRLLTDLPVAGYPLALMVEAPRYRCISI